MLCLKKIKCINIFDGKNEVIKSDEIEKISCFPRHLLMWERNRYKKKGLSLHVIVSNYFLNISAMN